MNKIIGRIGTAVLFFGLFVVITWVGWWYLRWTTGTAVFELVRDHLRDSLGLSTAVSVVVAVGSGVIAAFLMTVLVINARFVLACGVAIVVLGLPLALWHDTLSADQCFNRQTGAPLCELWETPEGEHKIRRMDGAFPPSSWQVIRKATRDDVRAYLPTSGNGADAPTARLPRPIRLESCMPWPAFFDAGGQAVVYWSREADAVELWDRRGPHPTTGNALNPMTPKVAKEVCVKLAAAQRQREAKLEQERAALATQQAAEQAAQRLQTEHEEAQRQLEQERAALAARQAAEEAAQQTAQRLKQDQEEAQQRLAQQRQVEERAIAERTAPTQPPFPVAQATLTLTNRDCWAADLYLNRQKVATVGANLSQVMAIQPGSYLARMCQSGTSLCGPEFPVHSFNGATIQVAVNTQPNCRQPTTQFAPPAPMVVRAYGRRNGSAPFWMVRR